jgi:hypothetical protein
LWLLRGAPKNKEVAERILQKRGSELTERQKAYLLETIRMGERAERYIEAVEAEENGPGRG